MSAYPLISYEHGDGDTPVCTFWLREPAPLNFGLTDHGVSWRVAIRILGIDTPDPKAGHPLAKIACVAVGAYTGRLVSEWIAQPTLGALVIADNFDKYGGRIDGDIVTRDHSTTLSVILLSHRFAHAYDGKGQRPPWTDEELQRIIATLAP